MHELSLGAKLAAQITASQQTKPEQALDFVNNTRDSQILYWKTIISNNGLNDPKALEELEKCKGLNEMQAELVTHAKKQMYGFTK